MCLNSTSERFSSFNKSIIPIENGFRLLADGALKKAHPDSLLLLFDNLSISGVAEALGEPIALTGVPPPRPGSQRGGGAIFDSWG